MTHLANLTISSSGVTATHTDFPKLVRGSDFTANIWSTATSSGGDLRFFLSDGTTEIAREVVSFDNVAEEAEIWIKIPSVSALSDTVIQIHADGTSSDYSATDTYGRNNVWSDYEAVLHLEDLTDSTGNNTPFSSGGVTSGSAGQIGDGYDLNGSNGRISVDVASPADHHVWTMQAWANADSVATGDVLMSVADKDVPDDQNRVIVSSGSLVISKFDGSLSNSSASGQSTTASTEILWSAVSESNSSRKIYGNDNASPGTDTATSSVTGLDRFSVGTTADSSPLGYWDGNVSEARLRYSALSADWIADEYADQSGNAAWHTITAVGGGPTYSLSLDGGTFALTGGDLSFVYTPSGPTYTLGLDAGSFSVTGGDVVPSVGRALSLDSGSYTLSGGDLSTVISRSLTLEAGSFVITGGDVDLVYTPISGPTYTLNLDSGSFSLTGGSVNLSAGRVIALEAGSFSLTGSDIDLIKAYVLDLEAGTFLVTGGDVNPQYQRVMNLEAGDYTLTGGNVNLTYSGAAKIASVIGIPVADIASIY